MTSAVQANVIPHTEHFNVISCDLWWQQTNQQKPFAQKCVRILRNISLAKSLLFLSESTQIRPTSVFFLSSFSPDSDDQLSSNFTGLLFYAYYVEIPHVRRLVFDNYQ